MPGAGLAGGAEDDEQARAMIDAAERLRAALAAAG